jgi:hypothetical protein
MALVELGKQHRVGVDGQIQGTLVESLPLMTKARPTRGGELPNDALRPTAGGVDTQRGDRCPPDASTPTSSRRNALVRR